jgi:methylene-tetrahydromethanopterin dehydrogenase
MTPAAGALWFRATGVVGFAASVIAALEQAKVTLVGYDGPARVKGLAETAKERFQVDLQSADGSTDALKAALLKDAEVVLCAGRAGVQILSAQQISESKTLKVAADINAVPPSGIEGIGAQDNGVKVGSGLGIGALAVGGVKYRVEAGLLRRMIETDKPLYLDFRDAFKLAREIVA